MSASPSATTAPSQKRPLEEPSSPSGPGDQPDAKRPALDKLIKDDVSPEPSLPEEETAKNGDVDASAIGNGDDTDSESKVAAPVAEVIQNGTKDSQGDTFIPDVATAIPQHAIETHPIESTTSASANSANQGRGGSHQDETSWLHMRAIISSAEAATVIGKGGENVTTIRKMSGAKCTVSDYTRGAVERILTVSGAVDAVAKVSTIVLCFAPCEPQN